MLLKPLIILLASAGVIALAGTPTLRSNLASLGSSIDLAELLERASTGLRSSGPRPETNSGPPAEPASPPPVAAFDVVMMNSAGMSVFAGSAPAKAAVTIVRNGNKLATVRADARGQWLLTLEEPTPPGRYRLSLIVGVATDPDAWRGQSIVRTVLPAAR